MQRSVMESLFFLYLITTFSVLVVNVIKKTGGWSLPEVLLYMAVVWLLPLLVLFIRHVHSEFMARAKRK